MKPVKHSVSVAVWRPGREPEPRVFLVRRPPDDTDLPNAWGLPAASRRPDEDWVDAAQRIGREKLGVELAVGAELREGTLERRDYLLHMKLYEARLVGGEPRVPQRVEGVTQYTDWKWGVARDLLPAARHGSLCCRLYLRELGRGWTS